jgi:hypothetical protein
MNKTGVASTWLGILTGIAIVFATIDPEHTPPLDEKPRQPGG